MSKEFNLNKLPRNDVFKGEILISRHYRISDDIQIELIKIATKKNQNLSSLVRLALREFINRNKK